MNKPILYSPAPKRGVIIALIITTAIHLSAIAIASLNRQPPAVVIPPYVEITGVDPGAPEPTPEPAQTEPIPPDTVAPTDFLDSPSRPATPLRKPTPIRTRNVARTAANQGSAKALALSAPRPEYPYEARSRRITGSGVIIVMVDARTGMVGDAIIDQTMGNPILDNAALSAFRRWRFKPGTPPRIRIPITFTLTGAQF